MVAIIQPIYQYLRGRCNRRHRGYGNEISSHHGWFGGGSRRPSNIQGHGSFFCGGEGSVIYSRGASFSQPTPSPSPYSLAGRYSCGVDGSVTIDNSDSGGTSGWGVSVGTVPVYGTGEGMGCSSEDSGIAGSSGGGRGSSYHSGRLGITVGGSYGYDASPRENPLTTGGDSYGPGYYGGGSGYDMGGHSGPEFSSGGSGSSQIIQQKCPVVIPSIEPKQSKQTSHWPPIQKK
ncbi:keratin, type I cytoskeletal 9-like [Colius striatus]|uniref:keratin, type I cytoskeletal 9-like n=1 Tax=Colius striatus TaxID=57412 RepID=UPI002B1D0DCC|nr:keratin, type I cytoskeletal 9-like [Colius striatus]